ncbi:MAG: hypothetical protein JNJ85_04895 [Candidatus Kapabacteria bacterium]|nr:hypothetical protein [Candidatus Kapabacteria bacterium]
MLPRDCTEPALTKISFSGRAETLPKETSIIVRNRASQLPDVISSVLRVYNTVLSRSSTVWCMCHSVRSGDSRNNFKQKQDEKLRLPVLL